MSRDTPITTLWPGKPYPLGATWDGAGVNFALYSEHATAVELVVFDASGRRERHRVTLRECTDHVWHGYLPEARPGLAYGYYVQGPYKPEEGLRFNANKLLIDPYARDFIGRLRWNDALYGYTVGNRKGDLSFDKRDSAPYMPKCRVLEPAFSWGDHRRPEIPWSDMVIYEMHVRGFTMQHPEVPEPLRGTYAGLASAPVIAYLEKLGVTTVELLPVHSYVNDRYLAEKNLQNYWGYNTLGFFAPEMRYSASDKVKEFKTMVKSLHAAGIEVILDVVYNHTCEGNQNGPTLSMRGIDNSTYYTLNGDKRYYADYTGTGNSVNLENPRTLQLVMDSLRYWVEEMHVDGFRFDLASTLAREGGVVEHWGGFFDAILQDPVLNRVKLIAEPWDMGWGGYQVGNFPPGWAEWNDRYRDGMRAYWKGDENQIGEFARRVTGSADLYANSGKKPYASINFVTAHDGFTLHDLVSYNGKHNEANAEDNRDGNDNNRSWNCGAEGPTDDAEIEMLRERQMRNMLATLLLSRGTPMILAGDEFARTQNGNNNAYCQDNEISWLNWDIDEKGGSLMRFVRRLTTLRERYPVLHRTRFLTAQWNEELGLKDVTWLLPDGEEMGPANWEDGNTRCFGILLDGRAQATGIRRRGSDATLLLIVNAHHDAISFRLPEVVGGLGWTRLIDTNHPEPEGAPHFEFSAEYEVTGRSLLLFDLQLELGYAEARRAATLVVPAHAEPPLEAAVMESAEDDPPELDGAPA